MGEPTQDKEVMGRLKETAVDPEHQHYWGYLKFNQKTIVIKCQVCGKIERRSIDRDKIPKGEV